MKGRVNLIGSEAVQRYRSVAACAYAGSIVAGVQFPDLADPYQMAQK